MRMKADDGIGSVENKSEGESRLRTTYVRRSALGGLNYRLGRIVKREESDSNCCLDVRDDVQTIRWRKEAQNKKVVPGLEPGSLEVYGLYRALLKI